MRLGIPHNQTNRRTRHTHLHPTVQLIQMVADEAGLDAALQLDGLGEVGTHVPSAEKAEEKKKEDDLEQRLAALEATLLPRRARRCLARLLPVLATVSST